MCILFVYTANVENSDYRFILASNRDEYYDRPAASAAPWVEDPNVIGGRDMEKGREGGAWLAVSPTRAKVAILLNLSGKLLENTKGRGEIVANYVTSSLSIGDYINSLEHDACKYNNFHLIAAEIGQKSSTVHSYNNTTNELHSHQDSYLGFGNSLPDAPLKKVEIGRHKFEEICKKWNKVTDKQKLVEALVTFLKCDDRHLPDPELQRRQPKMYEKLSSIYVKIPEGRYGTRTHTIIIITKSGHMQFTELTIQSPVDIEKPTWQETSYEFDIKL